jgi:glucose/mannose transport system permease protein
LILIVAAIFFALPVYVLVVTSLKPYADVDLSTMWNLPSGFDLGSFGVAWFGDKTIGFAGLSSSFLNSVIITVPAALVSVALGSMNGYVFAKWKFRGSDGVFMLFVMGLFTPYLSVVIPLVNVLHAAGLYGSLQGLIVVHIIYGLPITTLMFRNFFGRVPTEVIEAASLDGAGFFGIYRHILLPVAGPVIVVALIWQFTAIWNDFLFATVVTSSPKVQPITVALNNLAGSYVVQWNVQMAGAMIAAAPTLIIFIVLGRYFVRGVLAGSVKG